MLICHFHSFLFIIFLNIQNFKSKYLKKCLALSRKFSIKIIPACIRSKLMILKKSTFLYPSTQKQLVCLVFKFFYPPFTRKRIVSLCFERYIRTRLGVAISEESGPPAFHIKMGRPVEYLALGHNKRNCRLVLYNLP